MKTRLWLATILIIALTVSIGGCAGPDNDSSDGGNIPPPSDHPGDTDASGDDSTQPFDISRYAVSVADTARTYKAKDIAEDRVFDHTVDIDLTAFTAAGPSAPPQTITAYGATILTVGDASVTVAQTDFGITITSEVDADVRYNLSGELDGTLSVSSNEPYQLYLDGVSIRGTAGPALDLESSRKVFIVSAPDSVNTLTDAGVREMEMKAAVYGKGPMVFSGEGTIDVTGDYKHGIFSDDYIRIRGGKLNVAVTRKDAVRSVNGFILDDGELIIQASGTVIEDESKGIIVEGEEDKDTAGEGYVVINGGYLTITSVDNAISAAWDKNDADTNSEDDDPSPDVEINNGIIDITVTGMPYEYKLDGDKVSASPEGIEAKHDLTINSGYLTISATDDALNADHDIQINGGYAYCFSMENDAIDANDDLRIAGGVIVAVGGEYPEGAFDVNKNTFAANGGTFVGIGGSSSPPDEDKCTQDMVILGSMTPESTIALIAADGTVAFAFSIPQSYDVMYLSSPLISDGTRYTVYTGGTASADHDFYGLHLGNLSYSGGTAERSFTVSSYVTHLDASGR